MRFKNIHHVVLTEPRPRNRVPSACREFIFVALRHVYDPHTDHVSSWPSEASTLLRSLFRNRRVSDVSLFLWNRVLATGLPVLRPDRARHWNRESDSARRWGRMSWVGPVRPPRILIGLCDDWLDHRSRPAGPAVQKPAHPELAEVFQHQCHVSLTTC